MFEQQIKRETMGMTWINIISYEASKGKLRKLYDRVKGPDNNVDNIMISHSLRPHSMEFGLPHLTSITVASPRFGASYDLRHVR